MTQVTDRLVNSDIVDLAKKQFELERKQKIPTVAVNLSSKGLIYPESHPLRKGYVHMRHMSAYDEDILVNNTYIQQGIVFDMLLSELITDDIDINDIAVPDREGLIINAYILGYGVDYNISVTNPTTNAKETHTINLSTLLTKPFNLTPDVNGEFQYKVDDANTIKFRYVTVDYTDTKEDKLITSFLERCITEVNGNRSLAAIEDFLRYSFPPKQSKLFRKYYLENSPGIQNEIEIKGENGDTFTTGFQFQSDIFWA